MTVHRLCTGHVRALVALPADADTTAARQVGTTLPGGWAVTAPSTGGGAAAVEIGLGPARVHVDTRAVRVWLPRAAAASETLAYVTYTALERLRQRQRRITVHAAALHTPDGRAVLLLGTKGAGKTRTALALAERGWTHAGDDLVVLGEGMDGTLSVWPGTPTAALRDPTRPLAPKSRLALRPFTTAPAPLVWTVRLAVHPGVTAASLVSATPLSLNERLRLHENLGRYISGLPTPLTGTAGVPYGPVWPLDSPALARWRSHLIAELTHIPFDYLYAATPEIAADLLTKEVGRR